jgi:nuclear inhibitor of protein phosphatase 1
MYGRAGLDRFKKAETLEPFSVNANSSYKPNNQSVPKPASSTSSASNTHLLKNAQYQHQSHESNRPVALEAAPLVGQHVTQIGGGQSTWQPPDWAIEPRAGVYYLEVLKDGVVLDKINLDKRRHIFGRQLQTPDFVLDHQSVSRQHAAVVPHKNGRLDLFSIFLEIIWTCCFVLCLKDFDMLYVLHVRPYYTIFFYD